nr:CoA-acylating methylmalonate-semialdehyde dehydrogenase [Streptomyces sp. TLI_235]
MGGTPVATAGAAPRRGDIFDPATGQVSGQVDFAEIAEVDQAVAAAASAFAEWRRSSVAKRTQVLFRFRELFNARKDELASIIVSEHGKVHSDALGELARGLEVVEYACGIPQLSKGGFSEQASTGIDVYSIRQPLGPVAIISPFNFPAMVPMWFFPIAIATGNTVVLKPSEKDPSAANFLAELWKEAGLPDGVFNVVHGDKAAVDRLLEHPDIKSVSFVGSTPIARYVYETGTRYGKRVQALGGAKNHMLVLPDADLDLSADAAVNAGFGAAGERCMAVSVLVAVDPIGDELVEKIKSRVANLKVGPGCNGDSEMGPLVTGQHRDKVTSYVESGLADGAVLAVDGRKHAIAAEDVNGAPTTDGFWLGPTLFDRVKPGMSVYSDEIFGPVLSVVRVSTYEEGLALINANPYGNGTAIFTNDGGAARRFQNEVEVGMVGINVPIPVPVAYYSFGGWKASLFGDAHAYGPDGVQFFTRGKVVTQRWLDPSHGGINLGFPTNS